MKKNILLLIAILFIISGCGKSKLEKTIEKIEEKAEKITEKVQEKMDEYETNVEKIKIPDTVDLELNKAKSILESLGFIVNIEYIYDDSIIKGNVIKMNPMPNIDLEKGGKVTIYISKGSKNIKIEDYVGTNYKEAKAKLESKGLQVFIEKTNATDDLVSEDVVIRQSIEPDKTIESGGSITLYIPDVTTKYPDFTDGSYSLSDVQAFCDKYGINLVVENDVDAPNGTITYQSRQAGSTIVHNATLNIKVGVK